MKRAQVAEPMPAELARINLNLLVFLDALLQTGSVARAAQRVGVTPSAMSHALAQLRELTSDALLVRAKGGMIRTPRAEALAAPLQRALADLHRALHSGAAFDPARTPRRFSVAMSDLFATLLVPSIVPQLGAAELEVRQLDPAAYPDNLESGKLDVLVAVSIEPRPGILRETLFKDDFACVVRKGHPLLKTKRKLDDYLAWDHALISPRGDGRAATDVALEKLGKRRRVALRLQHFLAAPLIVARTDLVLTLPRHLIALVARTHGLQVFEPPLPLAGIEVFQCWHQRFTDDPAHKWLRQALLAAGRAVARA